MNFSCFHRRSNFYNCRERKVETLHFKMRSTGSLHRSFFSFYEVIYRSLNLFFTATALIILLVVHFKNDEMMN